MNIDLTIQKEIINVSCKTKIVENTYTFALAASMDVSEITNNGAKISDVTAEDVSLVFRPAMKKYTLKGLQSGTLQISYFGKPEGNFAFFEERFIHFSFYNGWYPTDFDVKEDYEVSIKAGAEYKILRASYHKKTNLWNYFAKQQALQDCNIICVNTAYTYSLESSEVSIYWFDIEKEQFSKAICNEFKKICDFYRILYGHDKIGHMDIVLVPGNLNFGAYMREGLVVFSDIMGCDLDRLIYILGHEIGHAYASGADISTYNDWLNETGAEWSSYLYLLENKTDCFETRICKALDEKSKENLTLCLKECGESRPDNVHLTGTLIYYEIYKNYGEAAIAQLLRIFDNLDVKNTDAFLTKVEQYNCEIAELLKQHI